MCPCPLTPTRVEQITRGHPVKVNGSASLARGNGNLTNYISPIKERRYSLIILLCAAAAAGLFSGNKRGRENKARAHIQERAGIRQRACSFCVEKREYKSQRVFLHSYSARQKIFFIHSPCIDLGPASSCSPHIWHAHGNLLNRIQHNNFTRF